MILKQIEYVKRESIAPQVEIYSVRLDNEEIFTIRFELESLLEDRFYVRMITHRPELLTPKVLKELRKKFATIKSSLICQCDDPRAVRFCKFFGFETSDHIGSTINMRIV